MVSLTDFPQEIIDMIIDEAKAATVIIYPEEGEEEEEEEEEEDEDAIQMNAKIERHGVKSLGLVCKCWLPRVRFHEFHSIRCIWHNALNVIDQLKRFKAEDTGLGYIGDYIQWMSLFFNGQVLPISFVDELLGFLPALRDLILSSAILLAEPRYTRTGAPRKLRRLKISLCTIDTYVKDQIVVSGSSLDDLLRLFSDIGWLQLYGISNRPPFDWVIPARPWTVADTRTPLPPPSFDEAPVITQLTHPEVQVNLPDSYIAFALSRHRVETIEWQEQVLFAVHGMRNIGDKPTSLQPSRLRICTQSYMRFYDSKYNWEAIPRLLKQFLFIKSLVLTFLIGENPYEENKEAIAAMCDYLHVAGTDITTITFQIALSNCDDEVTQLHTYKTGLTDHAQAFLDYFHRVWIWNYWNAVLSRFTGLEMLRVEFFGCQTYEDDLETRLKYEQAMYKELRELHASGRVEVEWQRSATWPRMWRNGGPLCKFRSSNRSWIYGPDY
ncbi:hypothetical protein QCA50_008847 [Cerrena zonata]|uniref:F-box domain-containing protein n=1 Tax=Cerrena zonata TaxID=2478898 RepID=A0AAW0GCG6_9APHY